MQNIDRKSCIVEQIQINSFIEIFNTDTYHFNMWMIHQIAHTHMCKRFPFPKPSTICRMKLIQFH